MILDIKKKKKLSITGNWFHILIDIILKGGEKKTISTVCDKRDDIEVLYGDNLFRIDTFRKFI